MGCAPSTNWCRISSIHCSYGKSMNMTILYRTLIYKRTIFHSYIKLPNASWSTYIYVCVGLKMVFTLQMTILMEMIIIYWNWGYPTFSDKPKKNGKAWHWISQDSSWSSKFLSDKKEARHSKTTEFGNQTTAHVNLSTQEDRLDIYTMWRRLDSWFYKLVDVTPLTLAYGCFWYANNYSIHGVYKAI